MYDGAGALAGGKDGEHDLGPVSTEAGGLDGGLAKAVHDCVHGTVYNGDGALARGKDGEHDLGPVSTEAGG